MAKVLSRQELRNRLRRAKRKGKGNEAEVPGPTDNPATNLMLADIAIRMGSYAVRYAVERSFLRGRYGKGTAKEIVSNRSLGQTIAAVAVAKIGTRSAPGAAIITTGLIGKILMDRARARSKGHEQAQGDAELIEQAKGE